MSAINLNDHDYDGGKAIFNNGQAGVADNVTMEVVKKDASDTTAGPDYKLIFTDSQGAQINRPFWYLDPNSQWFDTNITRDGKVFKHLFKLLKGATFTIPTFNDHIHMMDEGMKLIRESCSGKQFAIFCNYGTPSNAGDYLNVRKFVPFITKAGEHDSLAETPYDQMSRPQATTAVSEGDYTDTATSSTDW
jgi:hypothetical protein